MCRDTAPVQLRDSSEASWQLEDHESTWRFTVMATEGRPEVELNEGAIRLFFKQDLAPVTVAIPERALPLDPNDAKCRFSRKRGELVIEWPRCVTELGLSVDEKTVEVAFAAAPEAAPSSEASANTETQQDEGRTASTVTMPTSTTKSVETEATTCERAETVQDGEDSMTPESIQEKTSEEWRSLGNDAVKSGDLAEAIRCYSAGLAKGEEALLYSNRALCYHRLDLNEDALEDARRCVALRPDFYKGYLRGAKALQALSQFEEALAFLKRCPPNDEAAVLVAELKPQAEAAERARIEALGGAEKAKEEGNVLFRKGFFDTAAAKYTEALEQVEDPSSTLALAIRNNRAACYHQLSDFGSVVKDASFVLEQDPTNLKALIRRMCALEPLERYEAALGDARSVLRQDPRHEAANKVQHRLSKLVRDMQREAVV
mmetsp:Transcript_13589/g.25133  ORF Transcript_13589/g.25133 Transcript_13589/m.25133 type:complete len:432 (-) Transcript_13589:184-1479(-)